MIKKNLLYLFGAALLSCFVASCTKDDNDGNADETNSGVNWWYRTNITSKGVKSIQDGEILREFDQKGRLVHLRNEYGENSWDDMTYEYNSDNLITKDTHSYVDWQENIITTVNTYEYKNKGKFCPPDGMPFHLFERGLIPELSKVTTTREGKVISTYDYVFGADGNLNIYSTYNNEDASGKDVIYCDTLFIQYKGAYPDSYVGAWEFMGPVSYQENGMFDVYTEGFLDENGNKRTIRNYHFKKNSPNAMVIEKFENIESDGTSATTIYEYDDKFNLIKWTEESNYGGNTQKYVSTNVYEYDSKGNWIKCTSTDPWSQEPYVSERTIVYY